MKYPCSRKDVDRFEELNSGLTPVNLFEQFNEEERVIPDRTTKVKNAKYHVNLYMVEGGNNKYHFVSIKDLSRLMSSQHKKHKEKKQICPHCLRGLQSIDALRKKIEH